MLSNLPPVRGSTIHLLCCLLVLPFIACHKGDGTAPSNELLAVFEQNRTNATQTFSVIASTGGDVHGVNATQLTIGPNAFRDGNGVLVPGSVQVELVEALTTKDMVWLNMQTVGERSNGHRGILNSGGEIRVRATHNGVQVNVVPNAVHFHIPIPAGQPDPAMRQFAGELDANDALRWVEEGGLAVEDSVLQDSSVWTSMNYVGPWPANNGGTEWPPFTFINCDNFPPPGGDSTDVTISLPSGYGRSNTTCWVVLPALNCMIYMEQGNGSQIRAGFPVATGLTGTVVALSVVDGQYYSTFTPITITQGIDQPVQMQATTLPQFHSDLQTL